MIMRQFGVFQLRLLPGCNKKIITKTIIISQSGKVVRKKSGEMNFCKILEYKKKPMIAMDWQNI